MSSVFGGSRKPPTGSAPAKAVRFGTVEMKSVAGGGSTPGGVPRRPMHHRHKSKASEIRENWIEQQLQQRVKEFTDEKKFSVFVGTWNVNAKKPTEDLSAWLCPDTQADIYAIGFQEIVDLNAGNLLVDHNAVKPWEEKIAATLKGTYHLLCSKHLVGLALSVFVKRPLLSHITDIQYDTVGVGIMGVGGNKGACAVRFQLHDSTFCFVNTHLAAHQNNVAGRNADFHNICRRLSFTDQKKAKELGTTASKLTIFDHHHLFWLGDLNYRINMTDLALTYQRIEVQDWTYLLAQDQLILEKAAGNAFRRFKEGPVDFAPTYKYQPGTNKYERRPDKKIRFPAWCDRIQWIGDDIKQLWYRRAELQASDHRPVMALFDVAVKVLVPERRKAVKESLARQLDAWENESIPKVTMTASAVNFENTPFDLPVTRKIRVENVGQVLAQFHFALRDDNTMCKPWLKVDPEFGVIPPKESTEISITVHVTRETASPLTSKQDTLDDILIFRLENGRDYFLSVNGNYLRSCFGASIEWLVNTPMPVRTAPVGKEPTRVLSVPKELWRIVDYLFKYGMDTDGLFATPGTPGELEHIRECLDTGQQFPPSTPVHSMAEALLAFLESLEEPAFPMWLVHQYQDSMSLTGWCKQALMQLPPSHYNVFIYVTAFLRELLKHAPRNKLNATKLVLAFAGALMHAESEEESTASSPTAAVIPATPRTGGGQVKPKAWAVMRHFLTSDDFA